MYCLLELLAIVCLLAVLALILFVVGAAVIVIGEGVRYVLGLSAKNLRQVPCFATAIPKGWRMTISDQMGFIDSKADKVGVSLLYQFSVTNFLRPRAHEDASCERFIDIKPGCGPTPPPAIGGRICPRGILPDGFRHRLSTHAVGTQRRQLHQRCGLPDPSGSAIDYRYAEGVNSETRKSSGVGNSL
jgi:hypothetical protein